ncbi:MAG: MBL fold metallo-hydrolase [Candidatus Electryonea clarkiae]|nr:MBL fold metallo-hydrolase [Candidatus Electryonea clarkiae]MDP8286650.1 MBL fold metallo-hydrolase [Candidatus Electryonea clarkiae]
MRYINSNKIKITVLYDNYSSQPDLQSGWGFSCFIETGDYSILFDTGGNGEILIKNIRQLALDKSPVDSIILSHFHWDHIGGLYSVMESFSPAPAIYLTPSFGEIYVEDLKSFDYSVISVDQPTWISPSILLSGSVGNTSPGTPDEQALALVTEKGSIIITGCAHPGIIQIVDFINGLTTPMQPLLVLGGFHLFREKSSSIETIANKLLELGVKYVCPTHCSGDKAFEILQNKFGGKRCIQAGVGRIISPDDLN